MAGGRPTLYDPAYCDRVIERGKEGYSKAELAADIGVTRQTLDNWANEHPEFLDALRYAKELSLAWWESQPRQGLWSKDFNTPAWAKSMNGRFPDEPYRDRHEHTGKDGGPVAMTVLSGVPRADD